MNGPTLGCAASRSSVRRRAVVPSVPVGMVMPSALTASVECRLAVSTIGRAITSGPASKGLVSSTQPVNTRASWVTVSCVYVSIGWPLLSSFRLPSGFSSYRPMLNSCITSRA